MSSKKETVEQIYHLLMSLVEDEDTSEQPKAIKPKTRKPKTQKKTTTRATAKKTKTESSNKFLSMKEMHMFKEDIAIDRKLNVMGPSPRTRHFATVNVQCRVCGKTEEVNPSLVSEAQRYKCNECARSGG